MFHLPQEIRFFADKFRYVGIRESSSLSGVSVEDFVLFKFDVEAIFMGASYNSFTI